MNKIARENGSIGVQPTVARVSSIFDTDNAEENEITSKCDFHPKNNAPVPIFRELPDLTWPDLTQACDTPLPV